MPVQVSTGTSNERRSSEETYIYRRSGLVVSTENGLLPLDEPGGILVLLGVEAEDFVVDLGELRLFEVVDRSIAVALMRSNGGWQTRGSRERAEFRRNG